ncbi:MAG: hypothetical protein K2X03_21160 [Bryobacteraceae bacterium]|nr:hypothetical protein [Bryobacteraceae bacterium]
MSSAKKAVALPAHPTDKEFEEDISAHFQCAGHYVERNIIERDIKEVLELDIIATDYSLAPPDVRLIEIKGGGWGFPEIFKVYGWLKYLEIGKGSLIVKESKEPPAQLFYQKKSSSLEIELVVVSDLANAATALSGLLKNYSVSETDHSLWRFSYWIERNLLKRLTIKKKTVEGVKRFRAMDGYIFSVNSGVFFTQGAVNRAQKLYETFQEYPRLSAKCAHEELGHEFDDDVANIDTGIFNRTFYACDYTDIQISTYIEHRARLAILKHAIDHVLYQQAGQPEKAGSKVTKIFGINFSNAPQSFIDGLEAISTHQYFHRYAIFWQWFLWFFGGFILTDLKDQEFEALSIRTGIPVEEIPKALDAYGLLFPQEGGWFRQPTTSKVKIIKAFPVPFMGVGANLRKALYTNKGEYEDLKVQGQYTIPDLKKWNNLAVDVLLK